MDIHTVISDTFSVEEVVQAHMKDLAVQAKFGVTQIKYWVNLENKTIFCLMEGPDKESCNAVHAASHGMTACNIIDVTDDEFKLYLGAGDKTEDDLAQTPLGKVDTGFRTIMLINNLDFTRNYEHHIQEELTLIKANHGTIIIQPNEDIMASFMSASDAIKCARAVADLLRTIPNDFEFRIGLVTGSPVDEAGTKIFEETKRTVIQLCLLGLQNTIYLDSSTKRLLSKEVQSQNISTKDFKIINTENFGFLNSLILKVNENISDPNFNSDKLNKALGLSKSQSYRKIKALTGIAMNKLIQEIKLRHSLNALKRNNRSVSEIAYDHGFNSPTYFTRVFRNRFGLSPTSYNRIFAAEN